jgi:hypothetical protein
MPVISILEAGWEECHCGEGEQLDSPYSLTQDRLGPVDHDFAHIVIGQQRLEGTVGGEVTGGPLRDRVWVGDVERAQPLEGNRLGPLGTIAAAR